MCSTTSPLKQPSTHPHPCLRMFFGSSPQAPSFHACIHRALQIYRTPATLHTSSINSVSWSPYELGLILASASSDGSIAVLEHKPDGTFDTAKVSGQRQWVAAGAALNAGSVTVWGENDNVGIFGRECLPQTVSRSMHRQRVSRTMQRTGNDCCAKGTDSSCAQST
jgi:hypothetical protein